MADGDDEMSGTMQWVYEQAMEKNAYMQGAQSAQVGNILADLFAMLRAQYWVYQTAHWQTKGEPFYGDHLLFQRLYENTAKETDDFAEKIVGTVGEGFVEGTASMQKAFNWVQKWSQIAEPVKRGLQAEQDFQNSIKQTYDAIKAMNVMTLGLDDFLMGLASAHDTHTYLLQQRAPGKK
jgi:DNA-binding ferritin-like protein